MGGSPAGGVVARRIPGASGADSDRESSVRLKGLRREVREWSSRHSRRPRKGLLRAPFSAVEVSSSASSYSESSVATLSSRTARASSPPALEGAQSAGAKAGTKRGRRNPASSSLSLAERARPPPGSGTEQAKKANASKPVASGAAAAASKASDTDDEESDGTGVVDEAIDPAEEWVRFRALFGAIPFLAVGVILFEYCHKQYADMDFEIPVEYPRELGALSVNGYTGDASGWIAEYILSPNDRFKRVMLFAVLISGIFIEAYIGWCWVMWMGRWYELLQFPAKNKDAFWPLFVNFTVLVAVDTVRYVYLSYVRSWFMLDWHTWMTRRFQNLWLSDRGFYLMEVFENRDEFDNPDQRISEDAIRFCDSTWSLFSGFLGSVLDLFIYLPMLWSLSPKSVFGLFELKGWLVYLAIFWAFGGTVMVHFVGRILIALKYASQRYHADYRFALVSIRNNSESIAMLGAEGVETDNLTSQWHRIRRITWETMMFNKRFDTVMELYQHSARLMSLVILVPAYLGGEILLGEMRMAEQALSSVKSDFEFFVNSYGEITDWRAAVARLKALEKKKELACQSSFYVGSAGDDAPAAPAAPAGGCAAQGAPDSEDNGGASSPDVPGGGAGGGGGGESPGSLINGEGQGAGGMPLRPPRARAEHTENMELSVKRFRVLLPTGLLLVEVLEDFVVQPGNRVLISGPVGSGKSTFLRALADIWPHTNLASDGHFRLPPRDRCLFVPRVPVLPHGSLADAVCYPDVPGTYSEEDMLRALDAVGLGGVLVRNEHAPTRGASSSSAPPAGTSSYDEATQEQKLSGLRRVADWASILSGGEQQRVIIAHAILKKPALIFLDEATSAMSRESAVELYSEVIKALGPEGAMLSITHDVEGLRQFHNQHYAVDPKSRVLTLAG
eukprot:TRINITY_DN30237_c0_g5_i1.p1 TRINITY_DN30237_c0_g5~~TRINITY_DN30237_c0_g5_i1.p1  ORF type:complete len:1005 (-),score=170.48 TRINITY_DN30237_c0_g5_i1:41-2746(-)